MREREQKPKALCKIKVEFTIFHIEPLSKKGAQLVVDLNLMLLVKIKMDVV